MRILSIINILLSIFLVNSQFDSRASSRRTQLRPMTRNSVGGRSGPVPPAPARGQRPFLVVHAPGLKPPSGIAKKLNEAMDFRALARVLLKQ